MRLVFRSGKYIDFTAKGWQMIAGTLAFVGFVAVCGFLEAI